MSDVDILKQMAGENTNVSQALAEPPPQVQGQTQMPELDGMGLEKFQVHMTVNGYNTFLTIMHWAVLVQKLSDGEQVEWSEETFAAMSAGFVGFGNPVQWDGTYAGNIGIIVHAHYFNWHGEGAAYRKKNPLPHKLIREVAPLFANQNKGYQHSQMLRDLIADPESYEKV